MSDHTPLPWHYSRKFRYVSDINHRVIAEISPLHAFEANAAFIVNAVNNHDMLVDALRELHAMVRGECPSLLNEDSGGDAQLDLRIQRLLDHVGRGKET